MPLGRPQLPGPAHNSVRSNFKDAGTKFFAPVQFPTNTRELNCVSLLNMVSIINQSPSLFPPSSPFSALPPETLLLELSMEPRRKPSSHGRRLFELLEEDQDPFLLEGRLLENSEQAAAKRRPAEACMEFLGLSSSHGFNGRGGRARNSALPRLLQSKLRKALRWRRRIQGCGGRSRRVFSCFTALRSEAGAGHFCRLLHSCEEALDARRHWKAMENSKRLSPVSVLELRSDEGCSARNHSTEEENPSTSTMNSEACEEEEEEEEEAHCSARLSDLKLNKNGRHGLLLPQSKQLPLQRGKEFEDRICGTNESLGHETAVKAMEIQALTMNVARIAELMDGDLAGTRRKWSQFHAEAKEICLEIESFIFGEIREDAVAEMLGSRCSAERNSL